MNMTRAGRILVYANVVIACGMAVWAWGLNSSKIDYKTLQAKRKTTIDDLWKSLATAEGRERASQLALRTSEQRRPLHENFYKAEMLHLRSGANAGSPIRVVSNQNGQIATNAEGFPMMIPAPVKGSDGQPLVSAASYEEALKNTQTARLASIAQYQKQVAEDTRLLEIIIGDKGLRQQIFDEEQIKQGRIKQEIEDLKPVYVNVRVDLQLLEKRQRALEARVKELEMAGTRTVER